MKKDENSLFPDIKGPAPNKTRKILEEEYHKARQQRLLGKRKEKGEENNLEQPKEASLEEELQKPEKDLHDYTVYFEINSSHKEQIKKIAAFIDSIKDRKAS